MENSLAIRSTNQTQPSQQHCSSAQSAALWPHLTPDTLAVTLLPDTKYSLSQTHTHTHTHTHTQTDRHTTPHHTHHTIHTHSHTHTHTHTLLLEWQAVLSPYLKEEN